MCANAVDAREESVLRRINSRTVQSMTVHTSPSLISTFDAKLPHNVKSIRHPR